MERTQKKNTIGFDFGRDGVMPTLKEAISFLVRDLNIKDTEVHSVYLDISDKTFFVKFIDDTTLKEITQRLKQTEIFKYADGKEVQVHVAAADGFFRYVRLFNLPPEVTDGEIAKVLAKFGTVRQLVREKLPLELGFDAFSGTRGAHMEVKTEIPPALYIGHYKCRIFYEGLRNRCFTCKQEGHVKADCPKKSLAQRLQQEEGTSGSGQSVAKYADVAKGLSFPPPTLPEEENLVSLPLKPNGGRSMRSPDGRLGSSPKADEHSEATAVDVQTTEDVEVSGVPSATMEISPTRVADTGSRTVSPDGPAEQPSDKPRGRPTERKPKGSGKNQARLTVPNLLKALETRSRSRSTATKKT